MNAVELSRRSRNLAVFVVAVAVLGGCGGKQSAEDRWAESLCNTTHEWTGEMRRIYDRVRATEPSSGVAARLVLQDLSSLATETAREIPTRLRRLDPPDDKGIMEANRFIVALGEYLPTALDEVHRQVLALPRSITRRQSASYLKALEDALVGTAGKMLLSIDHAKEDHPDVGRLLDEAEACKALEAANQ